MKRLRCIFRFHDYPLGPVQTSWIGLDEYRTHQRILGPCRRCGHVDWREWA